jgi:hypothetical protein
MLEIPAGIADVLKSLGRKMPRQRYQRGTLKKVGKRRKLWLGRFQVYVRLPDGTEKRRDRTKILGAATLPRGEAQKRLDALISQSTGQPSPSGLPPNPTFAQLWERYSELKKATWATSAAKTVRAIFTGSAKSKKNPSVIAIIGTRRVAELTHDPLQALLNCVAERGESLSTLKAVRTYIAAALEYAVAERLITNNPARKLELPHEAAQEKTVWPVLHARRGSSADVDRYRPGTLGAGAVISMWTATARTTRAPR